MKLVFWNLLAFCLCTGPVLAAPDRKPISSVACQSLNSILIGQMDNAHFAKPDNNNAMLTLIEMNNGECNAVIDEETTGKVLQGALTTFEYLAQLGRHREQCPIIDQLGYFKKADEDKRLFAALKTLYCFDLPASDLQGNAPQWTHDDTDKIHDRVVAARPISTLKKKMRAAFKQQRLYSPAGDNAVEHALQIRELAHAPDIETESVLIDMTPYVVIAAEQANARRDAKEFHRLVELLRMIDKDAPALKRLDAIAVEPGKL